MAEEKIKEAFHKVKEDIESLRHELESISKQLSEFKRTNVLSDRQTNRQTDTENSSFNGLTEPTDNQTHQTNGSIQADKPTVPLEIRGSKDPNFNISIGNKGVQTDRQTNRQTDRQIKKFALNDEILPQSAEPKKIDSLTRIEKVAEVVNSLDSLTRDLRRQFKQLTSQEMLVFSTIYQLSNEELDVDYSLLSSKTGLSQSSIRDYIQKLLKKGIPLEKTKEHNKRVLLTIPPEFKRVASIDTILALRNL